MTRLPLAARAAAGAAEVLVTAAVIGFLHFVIALGATLLLVWSWDEVPAGPALIAIVDVTIAVLALGGTFITLLEPESEQLSPGSSVGSVLGAYIGEGWLGQARGLWGALLSRLPMALGLLLIELFAPLYVALDPRTQRVLVALARLRGVVPVRLVAVSAGVESWLAVGAALSMARRLGAVRVFEGAGARRVGPGPEIAAFSIALGVGRGDPSCD